MKCRGAEISEAAVITRRFIGMNPPLPEGGVPLKKAWFNQHYYSILHLRTEMFFYRIHTKCSSTFMSCLPIVIIRDCRPLKRPCLCYWGEMGHCENKMKIYEILENVWESYNKENSSAVIFEHCLDYVLHPQYMITSWAGNVAHHLLQKGLDERRKLLCPLRRRRRGHRLAGHRCSGESHENTHNQASEKRFRDSWWEHNSEGVEWSDGVGCGTIKK